MKRINSFEVLDEICIARKYMLKGGDIDYDRGCYAIISDFKSGRMGSITLESFSELKRLTIKDRKKENV